MQSFNKLSKPQSNKLPESVVDPLSSSSFSLTSQENQVSSSRSPLTNVNKTDTLFHNISPTVTVALDAIQTSSFFDIDLTPYQPIGWDAPLVISTVPGTHTNAQHITTADTLYIDFAILNNGPDYVLFENFKYTLSLDGVLWGSVTKYPPFYTDSPILNQDSMFAPLSAGTHEITLTVDSENTVEETNENNNVFHKVFTVFGTTPPPTLSINDISINEGSSGVSIATFTVTLSTVATTNVTVNYATANGTGSSAAVAPSDFTSNSGSLTFTPGQTSKTVSVTIIGDTVIEANETFFVNLSGATNAIIADNQGVGTILDDDSTPPVITVAVAPANVLEDGITNLVYTLTRTGATTNALTVNYSIAGTANATDYKGASPGTGKTITFAANSATATLTIDPTADTTIEANDTVALTLATGTGYTIGTSTAVTGTITNDDFNSSPTLSINDVTIVEGKDANAFLTVSLNNPISQSVSVNYTTTAINATAGSDYTTTSGTLSFAPNSTFGAISIPILNDDINESLEAFTVNLSNPVNATLGTNANIGEVIISDTWYSGLTRTLPNGVENLTLIGINAINGTGNSGNNILIGNSANNTMNGGTGNDTLAAGLGNDTMIGGTSNDFFVFNTQPNNKTNLDLITDFVSGKDHLQLSKAIFAGLNTAAGAGNDTVLNATEFVSSKTATQGTTATSHLIYNNTSGVLNYDADANGRGAAVEVAILGTTTHPALVAADILIIA